MLNKIYTLEIIDRQGEMHTIIGEPRVILWGPVGTLTIIDAGTTTEVALTGDQAYRMIDQLENLFTEAKVNGTIKSITRHEEEPYESLDGHMVIGNKVIKP